MKGKVLDFSENEGIILAENEKRYKFTLEDWKENTIPLKGDGVDFKVNEETAKDIYLLEIPDIQISQENKEILSQIGLLSGLGIIGMLLGWIPLIGPIISLAGVIILFIGVYKISKLAPEKQIFRYFLYAYIIPFLFIIGGIILSIIIPHLNLNIIIGLIWLLIVIPMFVLQAMYYKKSFLGIYEVTGVQLFETTAKIFYWGSLLSIIGIGIFIVFVGWIVATVAFFSLRK